MRLFCLHFTAVVLDFSHDLVIALLERGVFAQPGENVVPDYAR